MTTYLYSARNDKGHLIHGELEGDSIAQIQKALRTQGLFPIKIHSQWMQVHWEDLRWHRKVAIRDLVAMTRQFKVMFQAGLPMNQIFETLAKQVSHPELKRAIRKIQTDVSQGSSLSRAFAKHPRIFTSLYTHMLAVGEIGGVLDTVLKALSDMLLNEYRVITKVKSATTYPKIVLGALGVVFILMMVFVVPAFQGFYAQHHAQLPLPTQVLIALSDMTVQFWYMGLIGLGLGYLAWKSLAQTNLGKTLMAYVQYRLPVFGQLNRLVANARFSNLVSALYDSGLPISKALEIVADTLGNVLFSQEVRRVKLQMDQGKSMSGAMATSHYFTPMVIETTAVGEKTGALGEVLKATAEFYNEEVDTMLKNLTTLVEPLLLMMIFVMVGLLAFAIFLPVWNLSRVVMPG